jgi:Amt family ammonium transporter
MLKKLGFQRIPLIAFVMLVMLSVGSAYADDIATQSTIGIDTVWVLFASALVFFMQAGFGMLEAGFIRIKGFANDFKQR